MKFAIILFCSLSSVLACAAERISPVDFVRQSHQHVQRITPVDNKGAALAALVELGMTLPYVEELGSWADEALRVSQQMQPSPLQLHVQEIAIAAIAPRNPDRALELLRKLDPFPPDAVMELDYAYSAATGRVFSSLLNRRGPSAIPSLLKTAALLGQKGLYPYGALEVLMQRSTSADSLKIFNEAVAAYAQSKPSVANELGFLTFVQRVSPRIPGGLVVDAAVQVSARMQLFTPSNPHCDTTLRLRTTSGNFTLNCGERLIYQALPVLQQLDPVSAAQLKAKYAVFQQLAATTVESRRIVGAKPQFQEQEAPSDASPNRAPDEPPVDTPQAATSQMSEVRTRLLKKVWAAGDLSGSDLAEAMRQLQEVLRDTEGIDSAADRISVYNAVAEASAKLGDLALVHDLMKKAFALARDYAASLRNIPSDDRRWIAANGYKLMLMVRLGARVDPQFTADLIPTLGNDEGEAYLLMSFTDELIREERRLRRAGRGSPP
jgi:hypothetical protein